jgi:hypothetical protein
MPISVAQIDTPRAGRYLAQLCDHLDHLPQGSRLHGSATGHAGPPPVLHIDRADNHAVITFAWGTCTLDATDTVLLVRVEASGNESLGQAEALLAHRIQTIGHRDQLGVTWNRNPPRDRPAE